MKTIAISAVLDAAGPLAGRTSGFPAEEREQMRTPLALALETIWTAVESRAPGISVRLTPDERKTVSDAVKRSGLTQSEWARKSLLYVAEHGNCIT